MTFKYAQLIILLAPLTISCFGQKSEKQSQPKLSDFIPEEQTCSKIVQQNVVVTFPFTLRPGKYGAQDDQFILKYETSLRLKISEKSHDYYFIAGPHIEGSEVYIQSIIKYTIEKQKIRETKLTRDEIDIIVQDSAFILDFSRIVRDRPVIIDLKYSISMTNKDRVVAFLENNKIYNKYSIRLEIPEIYSFYIQHVFDKLELNSISKKNGEIIGYRNFDLPEPYLATVWKDFHLRVYPDSKVDFQPIRFSINISSYSLQRVQPFQPLEVIEILELKLLELNEIK